MGQMGNVDVRQLPITNLAHKAANGKCPLPAATGTARSARPVPLWIGWRHGRPICCRSSISTSRSRCRLRSAQSPTRTNRWSTPCCSRPLLTRCARSRPMRSTSAPRSAQPWCCIPGVSGLAGASPALPERRHLLCRTGGLSRGQSPSSAVEPSFTARRCPSFTACSAAAKFSRRQLELAKGLHQVWSEPEHGGDASVHSLSRSSAVNC